jgi:hypothetical protein
MRCPMARRKRLLTTLIRKMPRQAATCRGYIVSIISLLKTMHRRKSNTYISPLNVARDVVMGNTRIYIDLIVIVDSNLPARYNIKHGNYRRVSGGYCAHIDQFYIDGSQDGYPNGFQTLDDVDQFIRDEIALIGESVTAALCSDDGQSEGVTLSRWHTILDAWLLFQEKFLTHRMKGQILTPQRAKQLCTNQSN